jgi:hypothetical protein
MQRKTKRDEVHESVRYGTLDSPHGRIQGLSQARPRQLDLGRLAYAKPWLDQEDASNKTGSARLNGLNAW